MVEGPISKKVIVDDSGDAMYRRWLDDTYADRYDIHHHASRLGFCRTWRHAHSLATDTSPFVFLLEDDFLFRRPVNLYELVEVLGQRPHLAQISLVRQPWNDEEKAAGGLLQGRKGELRHFELGEQGIHWTEGRLWFTTNPSVTRRSALTAWGEGPECEGKLTQHLLENGFADVAPADVSFGYWGHLSDDPWVWHIGDERTGTGY
jgi:hypothetical protein